MDRESYEALIGSLWSVAEHLRSVELGEVRQCAEVHGGAAELELIDQLREVLPRLPRRPGRHH